MGGTVTRVTAPGLANPEPDLHGHLHHVELWVADLDGTTASLGWLLTELGYTLYQEWDAGRSWRLGSTYLVAEQSPALLGGPHDRHRAGLNHLAFHVVDQAEVDRLAKEAADHGWTLMFEGRHPYAGGPDHYAAYLENVQGFEVELVAATSTA